LRTCSLRSCSSGEDQLNTGTSVWMLTPVSCWALTASAIIAESAVGCWCQKNQSALGESSMWE